MLSRSQQAVSFGFMQNIAQFVEKLYKKILFLILFSLIPLTILRIGSKIAGESSAISFSCMIFLTVLLIIKSFVVRIKKNVGNKYDYECRLCCAGFPLLPRSPP
jgi:uncharacterized membrane protein